MFKRLVVLIVFFSVCFSSIAQEEGFNRYKLGSGDIINITVFGQEDLTKEVRLTDVGVINYPFLGDIKAIGLTAPELEALIYNGLLGDYLIDPSVSVTIVEYRPFFIDGEIKKPGGYPYQPGLSIDKAAALAGGYTERASKTKIQVVRNVDGLEKTLEVQSTFIVLPGDIVIIKQSFF
ncbi:polysaccharide biosynthesis/export family protein [Aliiglaciecola sp. 2_MG-2023]|uniref:polysaccharide biosynthesis/export family protein n=1 Tax=unclassified Aliiglaciecola TaxID=2593648 RepID=UPI0026E1522F|nr:MULTISPECIES: polysaccharide biosynthesis/export family protein [unclassified Aliiglaciecola]MDO6712190.1 polysaccharide biosynthesis/export family protein [Aliiglaciecola sp. 2_MG-2023]MDO6753572.1 polysaccharide biosynthesis/export family protein [Aliiglaciecola sp. 1_MG-2023]